MAVMIVLSHAGAPLAAIWASVMLSCSSVPSGATVPLLLSPCIWLQTRPLAPLAGKTKPLVHGRLMGRGWLVVPAGSLGSVISPAAVAMPAAVPPPPRPVPRLGPAGISAPSQTLRVLWSADHAA